MSAPVYARLIASCDSEAGDPEEQSKTADFRFANEEVYQRHSNDLFYDLVDLFDQYLEEHDPGWTVGDVIECLAEISETKAINPIHIDR